MITMIFNDIYIYILCVPTEDQMITCTDDERHFEVLLVMRGSVILWYKKKKTKTLKVIIN